MTDTMNDFLNYKNELKEREDVDNVVVVDGILIDDKLTRKHHHDHHNNKQELDSQLLLDNRSLSPNANNELLLEEFSQRLNQLESCSVAPKTLIVDPNANNTPPPSPADYKIDSNTDTTMLEASITQFDRHGKYFN